MVIDGVTLYDKRAVTRWLKQYGKIGTRMNGVQWIKITTDIFDDEKIQLIESMPEGDTLIVIWFKILVLAGKQNNKWYIKSREQGLLHRRDAFNSV